MRSPVERLVDSTLDKYGLPEWVKPYVYKYARDSPVSAVKFAISLIDVKRKKGEITKSTVKLPNGTTFKIQSVLRLLNLFFYGEESISEIEKAWASNSMDRNAEFEKKFMEMSEIDSRRTRAIRNLIEGIGHSIGDKPRSIEETFNSIEKLESWQDRILATGLILHFCYAATFGFIFYKVFYPVSPEFMRSFGKAFRNKDNEERWDTLEAASIIQEGGIDNGHILELTRSILSTVVVSIDENMDLAKELGLEKEVRLLSDISIAYPFQRLSELGVQVNVKDEVKRVKELASKI